VNLRAFACDFHSGCPKLKIQTANPKQIPIPKSEGSKHAPMLLGFGAFSLELAWVLVFDD
jgi:hypothetical protein